MIFNILYAVALLALSPWIAYRRIRHGRYRRGWNEKLFGLSDARGVSIRGNRSQSIWLHAVSVGEVQLLPEMVRELEQLYPEAAVVVSTSTDSGYDLACRHFGEHRVFFCPLDFTWAVEQTIRSLRCNLLILMELELWPNLIRSMNRNGGSVVVANARLSSRSASRYQKFSRIVGPTFAGLSQVGCQNASIAQRFVNCGVASERVCVTGSLKFDNAPRSRELPEVLARLDWSAAAVWNRIWCVGSTQSGEEAMAIRVYSQLRTEHPELRLILVPRHVERFDEVAMTIQRAGFQAVRRSQSSKSRRDVWDSNEILLIDTIGELRSWWGVATIATVGGSFGDRGGQNMLEPAGYGSAVSFGPNTRNFAEIATQLIEAGGAVRVQDEAELKSFVQRCLDDPPAADSLGRAAQNVIDLHRGAHQKTLAMLSRCIPAEAHWPAEAQWAAEARRAA